MDPWQKPTRQDQDRVAGPLSSPAALIFISSAHWLPCKIYFERRNKKNPTGSTINFYSFFVLITGLSYRWMKNVVEEKARLRDQTCWIQILDSKMKVTVPVLSAFAITKIKWIPPLTHYVSLEIATK